jgi:(p)ppGpp synthase/HD superfamily hydrolase
MNPDTDLRAGSRSASGRTRLPEGSQLTDAALDFARRMHEGQHRKQTHVPFVEHPIAVAGLMSEIGADGTSVAAAYLHDVVEKTPVELAEIRERFGPDVAALVGALTDDPALGSYGERKRELRRKAIAAGRPTSVIYAADRVANMRDWRTLASEERDACAERLGTSLPERLELWSEDLAELTAADSSLPFLAEIEIELRALRDEAA